jgi:hypothetical protein
LTLDSWQYSYGPRAMRATLTKPNGNITTAAYHEDGLVGTLVECTSGGNGSQLVSSHSLKYTLDGDHRLQALQASIRTQDDLNRYNQLKNAYCTEFTDTWCQAPPPRRRRNRLRSRRLQPVGPRPQSPPSTHPTWMRRRCRRKHWTAGAARSSGGRREVARRSEGCGRRPGGDRQGS